MLNFLPLLGGGRADLKTSEEDLIAMLPHDEGTDSTDNGLNQVQQYLEQEVKCERPGDYLAVTDPLIVESTSYWVILIQYTHTVLSRLLTDEVTGL